jgi:hypothetical protein
VGRRARSTYSAAALTHCPNYAAKPLEVPFIRSTEGSEDEGYTGVGPQAAKSSQPQSQHDISVPSGKSVAAPRNHDAGVGEERRPRRFHLLKESALFPSGSAPGGTDSPRKRPYQEVAVFAESRKRQHRPETRRRSSQAIDADAPFQASAGIHPDRQVEDSALTKEEHLQEGADAELTDAGSL